MYIGLNEIYVEVEMPRFDDIETQRIIREAKRQKREEVKTKKDQEEPLNEYLLVLLGIKSDRTLREIWGAARADERPESLVEIAAVLDGLEDNSEIVVITQKHYHVKSD